MKTTRPFFFLLSLLTFVIVQVANAAPAQAPQWVNWEFKATFLNEDIAASYYVHVGYDDANGDPVRLATRNVPVPCDIGGNVEIPAYHAVFDGGYIKCDLPDLSETADSLIRDEFGEEYELDLPAVCNCGKVEKAFARLAGSTSADGVNAVFEHPDVRFALPTDGTSSAHLFSVDGVTGVSDYRPNAQTYANRQTNLDCDSGACLFTHAQNGNIFDASQQPPHTFQMNTSATTIYIGLDTATGETFKGIMKQIHIDPGCSIVGVG